MMIAVASAKGSPGATTLALALASVWRRAAVLVEADADGGDIGSRCAVPDRPGLVTLALERRHGDDHAHDLSAHIQRVGAGVNLVVAPADARQASAAITKLDGAPIRLSDVDTIVDVGRLRAGSASWPLAMVADMIVVASAGDVGAVAHTAALTSQRLDASACVAVVGDCEFDTSALKEAFGVPVIGYVPRDERGVAALYWGGARRRSGRSLRTAVETIADRLLRRVDADEAPARQEMVASGDRNESGNRYDHHDSATELV